MGESSQNLKLFFSFLVQDFISSFLLLLFFLSPPHKTCMFYCADEKTLAADSDFYICNFLNSLAGLYAHHSRISISIYITRESVSRLRQYEAVTYESRVRDRNLKQK